MREIHTAVWRACLMAAALLLLAACGAATQAGVPAAQPGATPAAETIATPVSTIVMSTTAPTNAPAEIATSAPAVPSTDPIATTAAEAPAATDTPAPAATEAAAAPATNGSTLRLVLQPDSQVGYRVQEQLANRNLPNEAVGTTQSVTGTVTLQPDGTIVSEQSKFVADLSTLRSDQGMRDNYIKRNTLQTATYPQAVFVPTAVEGLPSPLPASGAVSFKVTGDLTVRGVTKAVTWDVQGQVAGNALTGTAQTTFTFGDFGMDPPRTMMVLSVEDKVVLEMTFHLVAEGA